MRQIIIFALGIQLALTSPEGWLTFLQWFGESPQNAILTPLLPVVVIVIGYFLFRRRKPCDDVCHQDPSVQEQEAWRLADEVQQRLDAGDGCTELQRAVVSMGLLGEPTFLPRVLEWYQLDQGMIRQRTTLEGFIPEFFVSDAQFAIDQSAEVYVPVLVATKGDLTSNSKSMMPTIDG
jgi:hypothetical protein